MSWGYPSTCRSEGGSQSGGRDIEIGMGRQPFKMSPTPTLTFNRDADPPCPTKLSRTQPGPSRGPCHPHPRSQPS